MENVEEVMRRMERKVDKLFVALLGSELTRDGGLVKRVEEGEKELDGVREMLTTRLQKVELTNKKIAAYVKILWFLAGTIATAMFVIVIKK